MPVQTLYPDGITSMFDSDSSANGVCLGIVGLAAGSAYSQSWPWLAGATVRVTDMYGALLTGPAADASAISVGSSPYPTVSIAAAAYDRDVLIWATGTTGIQSSPGLQAVSSAGTVALHPSARGLNSYGVGSYVALTPTTDDGAGNVAIGYWSVAAPAAIGASMRPVAVIDASSGHYVRLGAVLWNAGTGRWRAQVKAFATAPGLGVPLTQPDVYFYSTPSSPALGAPTCAIYDDDGSLAFDLLAGPLLVSRGQLVYGKTDASRAPPSVGRVGVFGSPGWWSQSQPRFSDTRTLQLGYWRLVGGALTRALCFERDTTGFPEPPAPVLNTQQWATSAEIVDLN